ncbi:MAG: HPr family phosphocarrier protein [Oscillospiraceae bacterium]|nr:HPr family phosphocarrier protein [Oscillospiraceae bacterium]
MEKIRIKLSDIAHIRNFANIFAKYTSVELDLQQGRYIVDAKSPMGIYVLDLLKPVDFIIHSEDGDVIGSIMDDVKDWIVEA